MMGFSISSVIKGLECSRESAFLAVLGHNLDSSDRFILAITIPVCYRRFGAIQKR